MHGQKNIKSCISHSTGLVDHLLCRRFYSVVAEWSVGTVAPDVVANPLGHCWEDDWKGQQKYYETNLSHCPL